MLKKKITKKHETRDQKDDGRHGRLGSSPVDHARAKACETKREREKVDRRHLPLTRPG